MDLFIARIFDGIATGALYASVALSLVLIYKATALINFAQGEMALCGAFTVYVLAVGHGVNLYVALLVAMALSAAGGAVLHRVLIQRFDPRDHLPIVLVTLGLLLALNALAAIVFGFEPRRIPSVFPRGNAVAFGSASLRWYTLGVLAVSVLTLVGLTLLLRRTRIGLSFRAVANTIDSAQLVGIRVNRVIGVSWALAAAIGTLAATLYVSDPLRQLDTGVMERVLIFAAAAAVLGGLDSLWGSLAGGLTLGLTESLVIGYVHWVPPELGMVVALLVLVLVLVWRPNGLFGAASAARV
ncbi:branched-chain amino acid ABC transporter permease [Actinomadura sp. LD22]|uniref:Branched-chain amino acid ABC transporter permease n=1 Tax=Actinomadura physcomitrii TaxID=2650748 RepID=A0A6I4MAV0_9ACTN|nr:branched-chain amino acid ABC transporter permease [Actinomadura physcomitrii]MWA02902.1 branched-chain amino acid ABC transporter permease [Actinomadura physcomitrii]